MSVRTSDIVTTVEQVASIPLDDTTLLRDREGDVWQRSGTGWDCLSEDGAAGQYPSSSVRLPALVLFTSEPEPAERQRLTDGCTCGSSGTPYEVTGGIHRPDCGTYAIEDAAAAILRRYPSFDPISARGIALALAETGVLRRAVTREEIREALAAWDDTDAYDAADAVLELIHQGGTP